MTVPRNMYDFIIEPIRRMDRRLGHQFFERWHIGPQNIWETIDARIHAIPTLWSAADCPDEQLQFLKWIVGWTSELDDVTRELDFTELRRLISASGRMWKLRGPEDTTIDVMFFATGARNRIWNWFDMRWVLDETEMGEEHEGRDPWLLDLPEPDVSGAEMESNLRIVDDGSLNKNLVVSLAKLMRPTNERIEITYLQFLDQFIIDNDDSQWTKPIGTSLTVAGGKLTLTDDTQDEDTVLIDSASYSWSDYVYAARVQGAGGGAFGMYFYYTDATHYYKLEFDVDAKNIRLIARMGGGEAITAFAWITLEPYYPDVWYTYRVHVENIGSDVRVRAYIDNNEVIDSTGAAFGPKLGTVGLFHETGATIECDDAEVLGLPAEGDFIDINS